VIMGPRNANRGLWNVNRLLECDYGTM